AVDRVERPELVEDPPQREERRRPRRRVAVLDGHVVAEAAGQADRPDPREVGEAAVDEHRPELGPEGELRDRRDLEPESGDALVWGHRARRTGCAVGGLAGRGGGLESTSTAAASNTAIPTALSPARLRGSRVRMPPSPRSS